MDFYTALIITIVSLAFSAFFSGMEIAFISSNKVRASVDMQKKGLTSSIINTFYRHEDMFISTMRVGNNIMLVVYGIGFAILLHNPIVDWVGDNEALVLTVQTIISTVVILITGEFLPKSIFRINPNRSLRNFALPLYIVYWMLFPISWLSSVVSKGLMKLFGAKEGAPRSALLTISELDDYLRRTIDETSSTPEGKKEIEHEVKIFQNALDFSSTLLRDCMVPRNEIIAVDITTDRERLRRRFTATGLSKIIVYRDDIDNVEGYIHVNELFDPSAEWQKRIKPVVYAPESMLANVMMRRMLAEKRSIAIIVDEFGGTGGLITLEDLVEEIFGDFEDEHDKRRLVEEKISDTSFKFSGRIEIEYINEKYGLNIPENEEYQTLAGFILYSRGEIPQEGDTFTLLDRLAFTILKQSATRINLVRLDILPQ